MLILYSRVKPTQDCFLREIKRYIYAIVVLYNYGEIDFTSGTREVEYSNPEL